MLLLGPLGPREVSGLQRVQSSAPGFPVLGSEAPASKARPIGVPPEAPGPQGGPHTGTRPGATCRKRGEGTSTEATGSVMDEGKFMFFGIRLPLQ